MNEPLYFGCVKELGHHAWGTDLRVFASKSPRGRWLTSHDGQLAPRDLDGRELAQGIAALHLFPDAGVTVLAFWDRSVDGRPGSNSMFLLPGLLSFRGAALAAARHFPSIWARLDFEVAPAIPGPPPF